MRWDAARHGCCDRSGRRSEFDNLELAARRRATYRHCPRPGYWRCRLHGDARRRPVDGRCRRRPRTEALPFDVIDLTPTTIVAYRQPPSIDRPSITSKLSAGGQVAVAPGDAIKVRIFEPYEGSIFPTIQRPGADFGVQRVTDDGTINVPFVGTVQVAGLDLQPDRAAHRPAARHGKAQDPQVIVEFVADRTHTVMVSGDVKNPGRVSILEGVRIRRRRHQPGRRLRLGGQRQRRRAEPGRSRGAPPRPGHPDGAVFRAAGRRRYRRPEGRRDRAFGPTRGSSRSSARSSEVGQRRDDQAQPDRCSRRWAWSAA